MFEPCYEIDSPSWCPDIISNCTCDIGQASGSCTSRYLPAGFSCEPDTCIDSRSLSVHTCEWSENYGKVNLFSNIRCVTEDEFLENSPQVAYDVPMEMMITSDCVADISTCGEKLLSSGSVRDALNLTIAKIANVETKDVLTISLKISNQQDSTVTRRRSLRYLATTTNTTAQNEEEIIVEDFNLEFTIQYDSNFSALNGTNSIQNATSTTVSTITVGNTNITETLFIQELETAMIQLPGRVAEWTTQIEIFQGQAFASLEDYALITYVDALYLSYTVESSYFDLPDNIYTLEKQSSLLLLVYPELQPNHEDTVAITLSSTYPLSSYFIVSDSAVDQTNRSGDSTNYDYTIVILVSVGSILSLVSAIAFLMYRKTNQRKREQYVLASKNRAKRIELTSMKKDLEMMKKAWQIAYDEIVFEGNKPLARGSQGEVWKAVLRNKLPCVVKRFCSRSHSSDSSGTSSFFFFSLFEGDI